MLSLHQRWNSDRGSLYASAMDPETLAEVSGVLEIFRQQYGAAAGAHCGVMTYQQVFDAVRHYLVDAHPAN